jgi:Uma2 family endonuclease
MSTAAATPANERLYSAEEYAALDDNRRTELVKGRIIEVPPTGFRHGRVQLRLGRLLDEFAEKTGIGRALTESGTVTQRDPDTVRGPDISFYSFDRLPRDQSPKGYASVAPEYVFEVLSPSQRLTSILPKVGEYLGAGSQCAIVSDPERRTAVIYGADDSIRLLSADDLVRLPGILAGWTPRVADFFPE